MKRAAGALALSVLVAMTGLVPSAQAARRPTAPVVMVVFDEMPLTSLLDRRGRIDRVRYPNFAALARGSTWYANATTVADSTKLAIPSILDGRGPRVGVPATHRGHPRNIFTLLRGRGYRLKVQEEATSLCPYRNCRRRHGAHYFLSRDRLGRFKRWIGGIGRSRRPTLYYKHALLPHVPWVFTPQLRRYDRSVLGPIKGLNSSERSVFDPTLVRQSWQRHLLQVGAVDALLGQIIARMKATGVYDRASLVVMADHGVAFHRGATDRRTILPYNAFDVAPIPLFIKAPRQRRGRISRAMMRTYDVLPTVAGHIGLRLPAGLSGRSASSNRVRRRGRVKVISRAPLARIQFSRGRLAQGRGAALRRRLALFGSGARSLYSAGPNARLLGRAVGDLRVLRRGRVRASLNGARDYRRIYRRSSFIPAHVTGRITGKRSGARRNVAVTVNGRVWAVTRSVRLRGSRSEYYSALLNPDKLVVGRNRNAIGVYAVGRSRGKYVLRRLR
ncbi:MAG TPA: sulfatase-like hydrolase/transferase [Thermoleophilaceae bacterium]|nr:sulfatase-like hydrolase/transferase [Thermoleophilaceae bacterium]